MDILEDLNSGEPENAEATPATEAPTQEAAPQAEAAEGETVAQKEARERDEKGRFKAKDEPIMVPLKALHETRDEVKALKSQLEALQPQAQPQVQQVPDIFENPEGFAAHIQNQVAVTALNDRLNLSEEMVRQSAGDETVNAAQEWGRQMMAANPAFAQTFYAQRNPYGFLVKEHQRYAAVSQIGDDPTTVQQFLAWKASQSATPPTPTNPAIPNSLAADQSARGGAVPYQPPSLEDLLKG